jgi:hypothetical protein
MNILRCTDAPDSHRAAPSVRAATASQSGAAELRPPPGATSKSPKRGDSPGPCASACRAKQRRRSGHERGIALLDGEAVEELEASWRLPVRLVSPLLLHQLDHGALMNRACRLSSRLNRCRRRRAGGPTASAPKHLLEPCPRHRTTDHAHEVTLRRLQRLTGWHTGQKGLGQRPAAT